MGVDLARKLPELVPDPEQRDDGRRRGRGQCRTGGIAPVEIDVGEYEQWGPLEQQRGEGEPVCEVTFEPERAGESERTGCDHREQSVRVRVVQRADSYHACRDARAQLRAPS